MIGLRRRPGGVVLCRTSFYMLYAIPGSSLRFLQFIVKSGGDDLTFRYFCCFLTYTVCY